MGTPRARVRRTNITAAKTLVDALEASFADALRSPEGMAEPAVLLWSDPDRQWEPLVARLRAVMPQLYLLGDYAPDERAGPSIWLRCVVDRTLPDVSPPSGTIPIFYLPGVSRQALRAGEECPKPLQPLVELQFRGRVWHQRNGRDWTVDAFLGSEDALGLELSQDASIRAAALRALPLLADATLDGLRDRRLEADDFDRLAVTDPTRDLLQWINTAESSRPAKDASLWQSFSSVCRTEFDFDPDKKSPADAVLALAEGAGKWRRVWERFCESPRLYPRVAELLRDASIPLFAGASDRFPQLNEKAEARARADLQSVASMPHAQAAERVLALEAEHGERRSWVWAQIGESPIASALEPLADLAVRSLTPVGGKDLETTVRIYATEGWICDRAALRALVSIRAPADIALVQDVVRALYGPWLDASARHFQAAISGAGSSLRSRVAGTVMEQDVCVLFADGLRFDLAAELGSRLEARGLRTKLSHRLAALPTVTATAKPLATMVHDALEGAGSGEDFAPRFRTSGQPATAQRLRDEMARRNVDILDGEIRGVSGAATAAWFEAGRFDELGHKLGAQLAVHLQSELDTLVEQISGLLECGWMKVRVVTDHGWLLLPGGLPRVELPAYVTATKWARCALVRGESMPDIPIYGWHWNEEARIASPPGAACFMAGYEYAHGGASPQECVIPDLTVERGAAVSKVKIGSVVWRGMRCRVHVAGADPTFRVDLRLNWKQATTSIVAAPKDLGTTGEASVAVTDDANEGVAATVVVLDAEGEVLDRKPTTVGETT